MRNIILIIVLMLCKTLNAQNFRVTGKIVDNNIPVEYAEVLLLKKDSTKIKSEISGIDGRFILEVPQNQYIFQIRRLNTVLYSKNIDLVNNVNLSTIQINQIHQIKEVVLLNNKKIIEKKIDRIVFNVDQSIFSTGADLAQVLSGTPLLSVNDNSISIVGKSGVAVMVNDKILNLSSTDLINYLRSLRSDDVSKIEVITTPPAKYEAQGNSGIINIILKKNVKLGWNGIMSSSYNQTTYFGNANNLTLNYNSNKITSSVRLRHYDRASKANENIDIIGMNSILSSDVRKDKFKGLGANLSLDYKLNLKSNIGLVYDISRSNSDMDIFNRSIYKTNIIQDSILNTFSTQVKPIINHSLYGYYDYKIDSLGKKLSLAANYFSNTPEATVNFQTESDQSNIIQDVRNLSKLDYQIISGQADLYLPFSWATVETGLKFTSFTNNSGVEYYVLNTDNFILNPDRSNLFNYDESNSAIYLSAQRDFGKKWVAKVGLRYENSIIEGYSGTMDERNKTRYGKIFPSAYLEYKINEDNNLTLSYSKRINRPNFTALNPFRWYSNPYSFYTGNPFLMPSYNHNVELSYLYKSKFSVTVYGQKLTNGYGRLTTVKDGIKEVNYKNYLTQYDLGLNASLYTNLTKWWENNTNLIAFYSSSESELSEVIPQKGLSMYYTINNTFTIDKGKGILFLLNFFHNLPGKQGNLYSYSISSLSAGFRFAVMDKNLKFNMMIEDLFKGTQSRGKLYYENFIQHYNNYYDGRRFTLSVTYSFGNKNVKANSRQMQLEEKNRAN